MTRQERRAAERAALKIARKQAKHTDSPDTHAPTLSDARLAANQANAQLSTGPRTNQGKAASSRNSFKHGLYSKKLVIDGEDSAELDALRADLFAEHQPQSETEALLVNEMADQYWRLRRARRMEVLFLKDGAVIAHLTAAQRMMSSAERGFHKALTELTAMQKQRGFVPQRTTAASTDEAIGAASVATGVGFVSQNTPQPVKITAASHPSVDDLAKIEDEFTAFDHLMNAA